MLLCGKKGSARQQFEQYLDDLTKLIQQMNEAL